MIALIAAAALATGGGCPAPAEDSPRWDWTRCGNHQRGVVTRHGTTLIVSPCRFQRLRRADLLRYGSRDVMRGDVRAMRMRCG